MCVCVCPCFLGFLVGGVRRIYLGQTQKGSVRGRHYARGVKVSNSVATAKEMPLFVKLLPSLGAGM